MRNKHIDKLTDRIIDVLEQRPKALLKHLKEPYRSRHPGCPAGTGFCAAASNALYHLGGGKKAGLKQMVARISPTETHWWVVDREGNIYDPTAGQFAGEEELLAHLYETGRGGAPSLGYQGGTEQPPTKAAKAIMDLVQKKYRRFI